MARASVIVPRAWNHSAATSCWPNPALDWNQQSAAVRDAGDSTANNRCGVFPDGISGRGWSRPGFGRSLRSNQDQANLYG